MTQDGHRRARRRPPSAVPIERVHGEAPDSGPLHGGAPGGGPSAHRPAGEGADDTGWRPEATSGSRHTRLADHLQTPSEHCDLDRAHEVCGEICRTVLGDFAPALVLLPLAERRRAQALAAYTVTLFDFALQTGVEGERLAALNRWEFALDSVLSGAQKLQQPVFVLLAAEAERTQWPLDAFDQIAEAARERVVKERPFDRPDMERRATLLGGALAHAWLGASVPPASELGGLALRTASLLRLSDGLRRKRPQLPSVELPLGQRVEPPTRAEIEDAARTEARAILVELETLRPQLAELPAWSRTAARYLTAAIRRLARNVAADPGRLLDDPPKLGAFSRLRLLAWALLRFG